MLSYYELIMTSYYGLVAGMSNQNFALEKGTWGGGFRTAGKYDISESREKFLEAVRGFGRVSLIV